MAVITGADAEELEHLAQRMRVAADRLDCIRGEVSQVFHRSHWDGHDAEAFRGQWHYRLSGLLHTAVLANRQAAQVLVRNAHQQRAAQALDNWTPVTGARPCPARPFPIDLAGLAALAGVLFQTGGQLMLI